MSRLKTWAALALVLLATSPTLAADDGKDDSTTSTKTRPKPKPKPPPPAPPPPKPAPTTVPRPQVVPHATPTVPARTPATPIVAPPTTRPAHTPAPERAHLVRPTAPPQRQATLATPDGWRTSDHRYARPDPHVVPTSPSAHHPPPAWHPYRPWYTHYWVHPWWRWTHATVVIAYVDYPCDPWLDVWAPPPRPGFLWVSGHWDGPFWVPGQWIPTHPPVAYVNYVWVSGWWLGDAYVEGYWRTNDRPGWSWVDGAYYDNNTYAWGYWHPLDAPPDGYVWEAGFWDGNLWVEGFWRPAERDGYRWVAAAYEADGVYHAGYWEPLLEQPGQMWIPGWFDGDSWIEGYWVPEDAPEGDPEKYQPDVGWNAGWGEPARASEAEDARPIAIPVTGP